MKDTGWMSNLTTWSQDFPTGLCLQESGPYRFHCLPGSRCPGTPAGITLTLFFFLSESLCQTLISDSHPIFHFSGDAIDCGTVWYIPYLLKLLPVWGSEWIQIFAFQIYLKCWIIILYMQRWRSKIVGAIGTHWRRKRKLFFKTQGNFFDNKFTPFGTSILMFWSNCVTIFTHKVFKENEGLATRDINCKESQQLLDEKKFHLTRNFFAFWGPSHSRQTNHQIKHRFVFHPL